MSRWRELARHLKAQERGTDCADTSAPMAHSVPIVSIVPRAVSQIEVPADPAAWLAALGALDTSRPPAGIAPDLWPILLADALWIARIHGEAAAALGWSASDLFGIGREPGNGGLADRLDGARQLAFTSSVARWRGEDCEGWLWRHTLTAKPVIWTGQDYARPRGMREADHG